jgi:hypothetical protein
LILKTYNIFNQEDNKRNGKKKDDKMIKKSHEYLMAEILFTTGPQAYK